MKVAQPSLLGNLRWAIFVGQPSAILGNRWAILGNRWAIVGLSLGNRWAIFVGQSSLGNLRQFWAIVGQSWAIVAQSSLGNLRQSWAIVGQSLGNRWAIFVGQPSAILLGNLRCPTGSADLVGRRRRCGIQCDQMTDYKISLIFQKLDKKGGF